MTFCNSATLLFQLLNHLFWCPACSIVCWTCSICEISDWMRWKPSEQVISLDPMFPAELHLLLSQAYRAIPITGWLHSILKPPCFLLPWCLLGGSLRVLLSRQCLEETFQSTCQIPARLFFWLIFFYSEKLHFHNIDKEHALGGEILTQFQLLLCRLNPSIVISLWQTTHSPQQSQTFLHLKNSSFLNKDDQRCILYFIWGNTGILLKVTNIFHNGCFALL